MRRGYCFFVSTELATNERDTMQTTYQDVAQMIRDGAEVVEVEAVLADAGTAVTDEQASMLRRELAERDEHNDESDSLQESLDAAAAALNEERRQPVEPPAGYFED